MRHLRKNTATRITVGPFLDRTDGITPEVALTATNEKLTLMVDDAGVPTLVLDANATASGGNNDLVHVTNDDAGYYDLELTAAQTNYLGRAALAITYATDHCPVFHEFMILNESEYDLLYESVGAVPHLGILDRGVVGAAATSTTGCDLRAAATFTTGHLVGATICFTDSGQTRVILTQTGDSITFDALTTAPTASTSTYVIFATPPGSAGSPIPVNVVQISGDATAADNAELMFDGTGYAGGTTKLDVNAATITAGAITAAAVATGAIDADALATDAVNEIADGFLNRDMSTGTDSGSTTVRTPRQALRALRNKVSVAAGTATITKEDDTTASWTAAITGSPAVTASDPAGP